MTTYTVHHPARTASEILRRGEEAEFVKDGFCWPALFIPLLWLAYRRLWAVFFGYLGILIVLSLLRDAFSLSEYLVTVLATGTNVLLAFEANNLRRWTLRRHKYFDAGVVIAKPLIEAERRFFQALIDRRESIDSPDPAPGDPVAKPIRMAGALEEPAEMVGLFPAPGARA